MQNILENTELGYTPKRYNFSDYNLYLYYKELGEGYLNSEELLLPAPKSFSLEESALSVANTPEEMRALKALSDRYFRRFKILANNNADFAPLLSLGADIQRQERVNASSLLAQLSECDVSKILSPEVKDLLESFRFSLREISTNLTENKGLLPVTDGQNPYFPPARSFQYLDEEWLRLTGNTLHAYKDKIIADLNNTEDASRPDHALNHLRTHNASLAETHAHNLRVIYSPDFTSQCLAGFETLTPSAQKQTLASSNNNSFLMRVYQDRRFQHWLCQLVLFAIVLTAALVLTSLAVKATLLPLAVATVVTGLSKFAANVIFGTAAVVGAAATVALGASLYARFFSQRLPEGGDAGSSATNNLSAGRFTK